MALFYKLNFKKHCLGLLSFLIAFQVHVGFADPATKQGGYHGYNWSVRYQEAPSSADYSDSGFIEVATKVKDKRIKGKKRAGDVKRGDKSFQNVPDKIIEEAFAMTGILSNVNGGVCHGTFISEDLFLTAAHCVNRIFKEYDEIKNKRDFCERAERIDRKSNNMVYVSQVYNRGGYIAVKDYEVEGIYRNNKFAGRERLDSNLFLTVSKILLKIDVIRKYVQYDQALVKLKTPIVEGYSIPPSFETINHKEDQCFVTDWRDLSDSVASYQQNIDELIGILRGQRRKYSNKHIVKLQPLKDMEKDFYYEDKKTYFFTGEKSNVQRGYSGGALWCYKQGELSFNGVTSVGKKVKDINLFSGYSSFNNESGRWLEQAKKALDFKKSDHKYRAKVKCSEKTYKKYYSNSKSNNLNKFKKEVNKNARVIEQKIQSEKEIKNIDRKNGRVKTQALEGTPKSQYDLAQIYAKDNSYTNNSENAYLWARVATNSGNRKSGALAKKLRRQLMFRYKNGEDLIRDIDRVVERCIKSKFDEDACEF